MKTMLMSVALAAVASIAFAAETVTKVTTTTGTIEEFTPGTTFVVKETSGPVKYRYGKKVTYVTKKGIAIPEAEIKTRIKVGAPVTVHYATVDDGRVIEKVEIDD